MNVDEKKEMNDPQSIKSPGQTAPLGVIVLMWAVCICALGTVGYFLTDYLAAASELSVVERQIHSIEINR